MTLRRLVDFDKVYFAVGEPLAVKLNPTARLPAYLIHYHFSQELHALRPKKPYYVSSGQLTHQHTPEELLAAKRLLCVVNFPRKQIGKTMSDCLSTGMLDHLEADGDKKREGTVAVGIVLPLNAKPESVVATIPPGSRVHVDGRQEIVPGEIERDLSWDTFAEFDIRAGNVVDGAQALVDFGQGPLVCKCAMSLNGYEGKQVLGVINLDGGPQIMSVGRAAVIGPLKAVPAGFRLA
ncbi:hypothetical protein HDU85_000095 [Gaertneriomyces sp. JEL0708]|nr:hypothetical protein HDU85_000095 [Gaertneriomyces sp. JEL0708]